MKKLFLMIASFLLCAPALALMQPGEALTDPALESRARAISKQVRCPVCESQNIENSNAGVATDLRLLIRERILAGDTDAEIMQYLRMRYGDIILMSPPVDQKTILLWLGPFAVLAIGLITTLVIIYRNREKPTP